MKYNYSKEKFSYGLGSWLMIEVQMTMSNIAKIHGRVHMYVDNGSSVVLGLGKLLELVVDNVHSEIFRHAPSVCLYDDVVWSKQMIVNITLNVSCLRTLKKKRRRWPL